MPTGATTPAVILIAAVSSGARPGALHVIDARKAFLEGAEKATSAVLRMIQEMGFDPTHD